MRFRVLVSDKEVFARVLSICCFLKNNTSYNLWQKCQLVVYRLVG